MAGPLLINVYLLYLCAAWRDVETISEHNQLTQAFIVHSVPAFTADNLIHGVTARHQSAGTVIEVLHPCEDTAAVHPLPLALGMNTLTVLRIGMTSATFLVLIDPIVQHHQTFWKQTAAIIRHLFPQMHIHATIPLPGSILQTYPNPQWRLHNLTKRQLRYQCRQHILRHRMWNLTIL